MDQTNLASLSNHPPAGTKTYPGTPGTTRRQDQDQRVARDHHQEEGRATGPGRVQLQQDLLDLGQACDPNQGREDTDEEMPEVA